eukprot:321306-Chlamydomonas_euryale.AAC.1
MRMPNCLPGGSCERASCRIWSTKALKSVRADTHPFRTPALTVKERPTSSPTLTAASVHV